ncbi:MAG: ribosome maturation factor RimM [Acetobacteraceae bacterium]
MPDKRILMGVIGRPHGVRGLVHIHSYTAQPADLAGYAPLLDDAGRAWALSWRGTGIAELRDASGQALADRTAAERLTNTKLYVERDRLPEPEADDFYLSDLVGLAASTPEGRLLGRVMVVHDYGAGASLEIAGEGPPLLVPFTRACVPSVNIAAGTAVIVPPAETEAPEEGRGATHAVRPTDGPAP